MAQILEFRGEYGAARTDTGRSASHNCEVIIFPGVRYERWDDSQLAALDEELANIEAADARDAVEQSPKPRRRKAQAKARDILVLPD